MGSSSNVTVSARYHAAQGVVIATGVVTNHGVPAGNLIVKVDGDWGATGTGMSSTVGGGYTASIPAPMNVVGRTVTALANGGAPPTSGVVIA